MSAPGPTLEELQAEEERLRMELEIAREIEAELLRIQRNTEFAFREMVIRETGLKVRFRAPVAVLLGPGVVDGVERVVDEVESVVEQLGEVLDFVASPSFALPELLEKLADLLLNPSYDPAKPCLAPAPLLRDLLDLALGKITGGIRAIVGEVAQTAWDFLLPAGIEGEDLTRFVESILADPVTAALNWILGKRGQIDCVVTGGLSVGESVLETQVRRLDEALTGVLS